MLLGWLLSLGGARRAPWRRRGTRPAAAGPGTDAHMLLALLCGSFVLRTEGSCSSRRGPWACSAVGPSLIKCLLFRVHREYTSLSAVFPLRGLERQGPPGFRAGGCEVRCAFFLQMCPVPSAQR